MENAAQINFGALPGVQAGQASAGTANASQMSAAQLRDPSQQGTNVAPAMQDFIYGDQGANQYLQGALQRGADQSRYNFQNMLDDRLAVGNRHALRRRHEWQRRSRQSKDPGQALKFSGRE